MQMCKASIGLYTFVHVIAANSERNSYMDWEGIFGNLSPASFFNFSFMGEYGKYIFQALGYTLLLAVVSVALAILPALLLAIMRLSKNKLIKGISGAYIAAFRSTPLLVQLSIIYFGLFGAVRIPNSWQLFGFIPMSRFIPGVVALALNSSAYVAEIFRGGILAVDVLPALANEIVTMVKESSICSTLGMAELMFAAKTVAGATYITLAPYTVAAVIYFCINYPASKAIEAIERRMRRGDKR